MFGSINPSQIKGMMKKMGIAQVDINAKRVIIECEDKNIIIDEPSVARIAMQGQVSYQISGPEHEEPLESFNEADVNMVMEKTGKTKEKVIEALKNNDGDIAETIMQLK